MRAPIAPSPREPGPARLDRVEMRIGHGIDLVSTRWDPKRHPMRSTDYTEVAVVEFMLTGEFRIRCRRGSGVGDVNTAVLFDSGEEFAVDHPVTRGNRGLSVRIALEALASWWEPGARAHARGWSLELAVPSMACVEAHALLRRVSASREFDALALGSSVVALLSALPSPVHREPTGGHRSRARIRDVRERLASCVDVTPSLDELAREFDCTPWHLAHEFTRWQGLPLHAYARALRLRAALGRLGTAPIGELAHEFGFSSHSHLSALFRREFGASPRTVARWLAGSPRPGAVG